MEFDIFLEFNEFGHQMLGSYYKIIRFFIRLEERLEFCDERTIDYWGYEIGYVHAFHRFWSSNAG